MPGVYSGLNMVDGWSQAKMRGHREWYDQHGRAWEGSYDIKSNASVCIRTPMFQAPWYPSQQYFREVPKRPNDLVIDYTALLTFLTERHQEYADLRHQAGVHFHGEAYKADKPATVTMLRDIGKAPLPLEIVIACQAGNGYMLGLRPFNPHRAGDVRLRELLEDYERPLRLAAGDAEAIAQLAAAFADDPPARPVQDQTEPTPVARRRRGRPRHRTEPKEPVDAASS